MFGNDSGDGSKSIISEEVAKEQFASFLEYFDIDFNDIEIEDGVEAAKTMKNTLVRAIERGALEISTGEELVIRQVLSRPIGEITVITYTDKVAKARLAMDHESPKKTQARIYAFMAALSDMPTSQLMKLKGADLSVFDRLTAIFSMV
ncbi:MAG: hypothetical protein V3V24_09715 [Nitrospinaceae bacterium]